jgi:hypothetical protein
VPGILAPKGGHRGDNDQPNNDDQFPVFRGAHRFLLAPPRLEFAAFPRATATLRYFITCVELPNPIKELPDLLDAASIDHYIQVLNARLTRLD